jgi:putative ABC transport system substrate-binding protein
VHGLRVVTGRAIVGFANRQRVPLAGGWGAWADEGGLLSYGPDVDTFVRRAALFVDRIVRGARPADLPVEQPTKLDVVVNTKTAKMLGLAVPSSLAGAGRPGHRVNEDVARGVIC